MGIGIMIFIGVIIITIIVVLIGSGDSGYSSPGSITASTSKRGSNDSFSQYYHREIHKHQLEQATRNHKILYDSDKEEKNIKNDLPKQKEEKTDDIYSDYDDFFEQDDDIFDVKK